LIEGNLIIANNGAQAIGSRPISNDSDKIYSLDTALPGNLGKFYGWPDYCGNAEPVTAPKFKSASSSQLLHFLMENHNVTTVQKPAFLMNGINGIGELAFSSNNSLFGQRDGSCS